MADSQKPIGMDLADEDTFDDGMTSSDLSSLQSSPDYFASMEGYMRTSTCGRAVPSGYQQMASYADFGPSLASVASSLPNCFEHINNIAATPRVEDLSHSQNEAMDPKSFSSLVSQNERAVAQNTRSHIMDPAAESLSNPLHQAPNSSLQMNSRALSTLGASQESPVLGQTPDRSSFNISTVAFSNAPLAIRTNPRNLILRIPGAKLQQILSQLIFKTPKRNLRKRKFSEPRSTTDLAPASEDPTAEGSHRKAASKRNKVLEVQPRTRKPREASNRGKARRQSAPYHINAQEGKPEPFGEPCVWADKRQQLCETLPYYRAYQSALYSNEGIAHGFMCDKEVGVRDKFDDQILISRIGGGRKKDENGNMVQSKDQNELDSCSAAKACRNSKRRGVPVAVIAGQGNSISPCRLPHYYNVLGWFHVTDVWSELVDNYKCWKVRLEKIELGEKSWWAPKELEHHAPNYQFPKTGTYYCQTCKATSKSIFTIGGICLQPGCASYFQMHGEVIPDRLLEYTEEFLKERTESTQFRELPSLRPSLLTNADLRLRGSAGFDALCARGIVCKKCGCCSRRIEWHQWSCENPSCNFTYQVTQRCMTASEAMTQQQGLVEQEEIYAKDIKYQEMCLSSYNVYQYDLPDENGTAIGFVRIFKANELIREQPDGPNDLFMQMQGADFGLKRTPTRCHGTTQEVLTGHWLTNWGAPYKFIAAGASRSFSEAEPVIIKAVKRLTWAGQQALTANNTTEAFQDFNELLSIGYFEEHQMGYHDDGEHGLGPTIASLSLGASSTMFFRPKAKTAIEGYNTHKKKRANANGTKYDALKIRLDHGDIMVMHGRKIQEYYEHKVASYGKLRFALTCRYIDPESCPGPEAARIAGTLPPGSDQYTYNGDLNSQRVEKKFDQGEWTKSLLKGKLETGELKIDQLAEILKSLIVDGSKTDMTGI